ncbi:MAG: hypothetical protein M3437_02015 [Chloroflexota bacterium]|nr:hypothetical protein [Chloroflexota bacterium]MDQ5865767.1 hypothetical protein [Chloroflexota bacterium]
MAVLVSGSLLAGIGSTGSRASAANDYGTPDPTFGKGGKVTTEMGSDLEQISAMLVQPDGKIVVVGDTWPMPDDWAKFTIARYNADGTLDKKFGKSGRQITNVTGSKDDFSMAQAVALQPDGKLVVVGTATDPRSEQDVFAVVRYNSNGVLDSSFGKKGKVLTPINPSTKSESMDFASAVAIDSEGKILVGGSTGTDETGQSAVVRYNPDGSLDKTFGKGGKAVVDLGGEDSITSMTIQEDGKIVVAGDAMPDGEQLDIMAGRLNADGTVDESFGDDGKQIVDVDGGMDLASGVAVLADGSIVVSGSAQVGEVSCVDDTATCPKFGPVLVKLTQEGDIDESWGKDGLVLHGFTGTTPAHGMAVRADGRIALGGALNNEDFMVMLFDEDGDLDESFGDKGVAVTHFGTSKSRAYTVAWQPDGKIVAGGELVTEVEDQKYGNYDFALVRYQAPPVE